MRNFARAILPERQIKIEYLGSYVGEMHDIIIISTVRTEDYAQKVQSTHINYFKKMQL